MVDSLADRKSTLKEGKFEELATDLGLTYNPLGLLRDHAFRDVFDCTKHVLRDSMHALASNGIIGTELAMILPRLQATDPNWSFATLRLYAQSWILPKRLGSVKSTWFDKHFMRKDKTQYFAAEEVSQLSLLYAFLLEVVKPTKQLTAELASFGYLYRITSILMMGPDMPLSFIGELEDLIFKHHQIYSGVYPRLAIKEKYHRLLHVPDTIVRIGSNLTCWATERKHTRVKGETTFLFDHIEKTSVLGLLEKQLMDWSSEHWFRENSLVNARIGHANGLTIETSTAAHLKCGMLYKGDLIYIDEGDRRYAVGQVVAFFAIGDDMCVHVKRMTPTDEDEFWLSDPMVDSIIDVSSVMTPLFWSPRQDHRARIIVPVTRSD